jgi:two-component system OmpR family response regulator
MTQTLAPQILIVDGARDIREPLGLFLRRHGFRARLAASAAEGRRIVVGSVIHLAILDMMMPGEDGFGFFRLLVAEWRVPVILLSALDSEEDRIAGLDLGADDYVVKPFSPRELLARIRAVLRRAAPASPAPGGLRRFDGMVHDADRQHLILADGRKVALTTGESRLLAALLGHPGEVLSRAWLLDLVRGREPKAYDRTADNIVSRLRRKIGDDDRAEKLIVTEWGSGYRLAATVEILP